MANLPLPRNPDGALILPGRIRKTLVEPFLNATALPSWLTLAAGTATFNTTGRGEVIVTTGATVGNQAKIAMTAGVNLAAVEAVLWEVEGFYTDFPASPSGDFGIGLAGNGGGAYLTDVANGAGSAQFNTSGSTNPVVTNYNWRLTSEAVRHRNIGLLMLTRAKHIYVLEGDQVMGEADYSASLVLNTAVPDISITTKETTAHFMKIAQIRLTVTCN